MIDDELREIEAVDAELAVEFAPSAPAPRAAVSRPSVVGTVGAGGGGAGVSRIKAAATDGGDATLTGPQRKLLGALSWWRGMGHDEPSRPQISAIAQWSVKSSNLRDRLGELSSLGLVEYPRHGFVRLTDDGLASAPTPDLSRTLHDSIRRYLSGPQLKIFEALLRYPPPIDRPTLAEVVGWEPTSSNLRDRLGELSSLEIVRYPRPGFVELQSWVMA
jgi:hypothetical protein